MVVVANATLPCFLSSVHPTGTKMKENEMKESKIFGIILFIFSIYFMFAISIGGGILNLIYFETVNYGRLYATLPDN
jgi:hypothetical protein